tara:strand:- start:153 stop:683 length:531 start_codon:yes stop_codon:yes gene_type:complete
MLGGPDSIDFLTLFEAGRQNVISAKSVPDMSKLNDSAAATVDQGPGATQTESTRMLNGHTVLVLETEFIIALGLQSALQAMGAAHVVLARSPDEANQHRQDWSNATLAIVEVESDRPELIAFAQQLAKNGTPVIGLTADSIQAKGVPDLPGTPILLKPLPDAELAEAIRARFAQKP